jgi:hypothetical protein
MIESITATGEVLNPGIIFKGKELQEQWFIEQFRQSVPSWHFITSPNGWTNNQIGVAWLQQVFLPQMNNRREDDLDAILLILDGHFSHTTVGVKARIGGIKTN